MKKDKKKNLRELPSGSFQYRKMIDGQSVNIVFDHEPTEKEIAKAVSKELSAAGDRVPKNSFGKLCEKYIEIKRPILSPSTIRTYGTITRSISEQLRITDINDITQPMIQAEIGIYSQEHSPKSVANFHGFISAVLKMYRPKFQLSTTLPQRVRFDPLTPEEDDIRRILEAVKDSAFSVPFQLGILGLRRSEICALELSDLSGNDLSITKAKVKSDSAGWIVKNLTKTTEGKRTVYVPDSLKKEIEEEGMFEGSPDLLLKKLHRIQKELGIPEFRFHDLRAFYCSYAHSKGVPDSVIMACGGWKSPYVMRSIYRRALEHDKREYSKMIASSILT